MNKDSLTTAIMAATLDRSGNPAIPESVVSEYLEQARLEYGKYHPSPRVLPGVISLAVPYLEAAEGEEIVAVSGVYQYDYLASDYYEYYSVFNSFLEQRDMVMNLNMVRDRGLMPSPALNYVDAYYREKAVMECSHYRAGNRIIPTLHNIPARVIAVYGVVPTWEEIPESERKLFQTFVSASHLRSVATGSNGLTRIPTPVGSFDFDGGKITHAASQALFDQFYGELGAATGYVTSG